MSTSRTRFTAVAAAVLAVACGGGDGGDTVVPQPSPYVLITNANQDAVARSSIAATEPFLTVPVIFSSPSPALAKPAHAGATAALGGHGGVARLAMRALDFGYGKATAAPAGMARPLVTYPPDVVPCSVSGNMTVTWDDKDNNRTPSAGDSVSVSFNMCRDGDGVVNGGMAMAIATYSETSTAEDVTGSITFQSLSYVNDPFSYTMNGDAAFRLTFTLKPDGAELFGSFTVGVGGMTVAKQAVAAGGLSDSFSYRAGFTVSDRDFTSNVVGVPSSEIITASGDFGSQALGGDLTLSTITPIKSVYTDPTGDIFPTEGQLLVSGRDGTKLRLTATQTIEVRMEVSDDSDADWEYTKMVTWPWLLS